MIRNEIILCARVLLLLLFSPARVFAESEGQVFVTLSGETLKESPCGAVLESSGIGKAPQGRSRAQSRLLAERAAKVRAYRNLVQAVDRLNPLLIEGSGLVSATGFIRGARIVEKSYLPDGRVEIKIRLDVHFSNPESECEAWIQRKIGPYGFPIYHVDRKVVEVSEEEWVNLNKGSKV